VEPDGTTRVILTSTASVYSYTLVVISMDGWACSAAAMASSSRSGNLRIRSPESKKSWLRRYTRVSLSKSMVHSSPVGQYSKIHAEFRAVPVIESIKKTSAVVSKSRSSSKRISTFLPPIACAESSERARRVFKSLTLAAFTTLEGA